MSSARGEHVSPTVLSAVFAVLALGPISVQIALAFGAPFGHLTMGGRWPGRLPRHARALAGVQAVTLVGMAAAILSVARGVWPVWVGWPVLAILALSVDAHIVTPSRAERRLWLPVIAAMFVSALVTVWLVQH